jgi:tRNA U55 pseudouridine synthase TruB
MNKTEKTKEEKKIKEYKNRQQETKKEKRERRKLRRKESKELRKSEQEKKNDDKNLEKILFLHKEIGETPLQVLDNFKKDNKNYSDIKMAYAGRLDPLASGKLLVLVGNECKKRDKYLSLDKEYIFEILLDFKSDSQDVLGIPIFSDKSHQKTTENIIKIKDKKFFKKIDTK